MESKAKMLEALARRMKDTSPQPAKPERAAAQSFAAITTRHKRQQRTRGLIEQYLARLERSGPPAELRTVGPICETILQQQYELAARAAQKAYRQKPQMHILLALQVLCYFRLSLAKDGIPLLLTLRKIPNANSDPDLLKITAFLLDHTRDFGAPMLRSTIADMYEEAALANPSNVEILKQVFLFFVRESDYRRMQQFAFKWYKLSAPSTPTPLSVKKTAKAAATGISASNQEALKRLYTAVMTLLILATSPRHLGTSNKTILLGIAAKVLSERDKFTLVPETAREFYVRIELLRLQASDRAPSRLSNGGEPLLDELSPAALKARNALFEVFNSDQGIRCCNEDLALELSRREYELELGTETEWRSGWQRCTEALEMHNDTNWHTIISAIRFAFKLSLQNRANGISHDDEEDLAESALAAAPVIQDATQSLVYVDRTQGLLVTLAEQRGKHERGYELGLLEIARTRRERGQSQPNALPGLIESYFDHYAQKPCCYEDLAPYLSVLTAQERALLRQVPRFATQDTIAANADVQRTINAEKVARCLHDSLAEEEHANDGYRYIGLYCATLGTNKKLSSTDLLPGDDFALLAGQALVSAYHVSGGHSHLECAVGFLEFATRLSPYKYQLAFLFQRICRMLGLISQLRGSYKSLDLKSVQQDTLSHFMMDRATSLIFADSKGKIVDDMVRTAPWYLEGEDEAREAVSTRLSESLSKALLQLEIIRESNMEEAAIANLTYASALLPTLDSPAFRGVSSCDNRDFGVLPNLNPANGQTALQQTALGPNTSMSWVRAMYALYTAFFVDDCGPKTVAAENLAFTASLSAREGLTPSEVLLLKIGRDVIDWLYADGGSGKGKASTDHRALSAKDDEVANTFRILRKSFHDAIAERQLPWHLCHIATTTLEAYCLIDVMCQRRFVYAHSPAENRVPTNDPEVEHRVQIWKRLEKIRSIGKDALAVISNKLTAHAKEYTRDRLGGIDSLKPLSQYDLAHDSVLKDRFVNEIGPALRDAQADAFRSLANALTNRVRRR
ncbi:uncharacterized protein L969DRAFT_104854 [Mixia osmundae IAM 14324]|uniref:uncharacterized protein n=1 Tax=Mixia osmundae (strain CBS 9802 / IAM 14324 / JCM 22182 / KY 12970) TaxID=764103 RepID=UPI0004A54F34|nr:uncharacterized protein L969DRAFT_104854 [Mixia osmundae IAM 14324]KEI37583.1 hypothetical protein L969DRAFT_104854 [Mixia osmundae IAM 14324]